MKWEEVDNGDYAGLVCRTRVPWGWIVKYTEDVIHNRLETGQGMVGGWDWRTSITFVFDPFHWWRLK
jgi:hypothetical protein